MLSSASFSNGQLTSWWISYFRALDNCLLLLRGACRSVWLLELGHGGERRAWQVACWRDRGVTSQLVGVDSSHCERVPAVVWVRPLLVVPLLADPAVPLLKIERNARFWIVRVRWKAE